MLWLKEAIDKPNVNISSQDIYTRFRPIISPIVPRGSARLALTSRKDTLTQITIDGSVLREPVKIGYATLMILPSSVVARTPTEIVPIVSHLYILDVAFM